MRFILLVILFVSFAYALGLVVVNNNMVEVNLFFSHAPQMGLGLLIIIVLSLGVLIGLMLSLLMFRVLQNKWEISRLKKENISLQQKLTTATVELERQKQVETVPLEDATAE